MYICVCIKSGALSTTHVTSPAVAVAVNVLAHPTGSSSSRSRLFTPLHFTWLSLHSSSIPFMPTQHIRFIYGVQISIGRPSRRASCVSLCVSSAAAATVCACVWPSLSLLPSLSFFALAQSICCPLATKLRCCVWCENFDSNASFALKLRRSR